MFTEYIYENSLVIGLIVLVILVLLNRYYGFELMRLKSDSANSAIDTNYCESTDCVRCNKYRDTLAKAFERLKRLDHNFEQTRERILNGINHGPFLVADKQQPSVFFLRELESVPVWNRSGLFADCYTLEEAFIAIKAECLSLLTHGKNGLWKTNRTPQGLWEVFHMIDQGKEIQENACLCPETMTVVRSLQSAMLSNVFGNVMFSVLKSGTIITEHFGPTNIRLRCHLGLSVPFECTLCVDEESVTWNEGQCLVFDDSFLHSVTHFGGCDEPTVDRASVEQHTDFRSLSNNDSDQTSIIDFEKQAFNARDRVVLIVDLWHPALTLEEKEAIDFVFSP